MSSLITYIIDKFWQEPELKQLFFRYSVLISGIYCLFRLCKRASKTVVISCRSDCEKEMQFLVQSISEYPVIGLDCEFTSGSTKGGHPEPAILQLANKGKHCAIIQIKVMKNIYEDSEYYSPFTHSQGIYSLFNILKSPNILKVGVGVMNDAMYLERSYGFQARGILDLRFLAVENNIEPRGLDKLAKSVLGSSKSSILKSSQPWESEHLTKKQIEYAAKDARLGFDLFFELNERTISRKYPWLSRLFSDETYWKYTMDNWKSCVDKHFSFGKEYIYYEPECSFNMHYKDLFQTLPKGMTVYWPNYIIYEAIDIHRLNCNVCGDKTNTMVTAIVPLDYYNSFNDNHLPRYLYLCSTCMVKSQNIRTVLRQRLSKVCGAPYPDYADEQLKAAKESANYLLLEYPRHIKTLKHMEYLYYKSTDISNFRKAHSEIYDDCVNLLSSMFNLHPKYLSREMLEVILNMDCQLGSEHGKFVIEYYDKFNQSKIDLHMIWCTVFVKLIKPTRLPDNWLRYCKSNGIYNLKFSDLDLGISEKDMSELYKLESSYCV